MDLDDLKHKYQSLKLSVRLFMALVIGLIPALYVYFDEGSVLSEELETLTLKEQSARTNFEKARRQKSKLPELEEKLAFTESQMVKARQYLPEVFRVEEILQRVSQIAKETGVDLINFLPREEVKLDKGYPVVEIPVSAEILGTYMNIATFIDRIVHLDATVFVKSINMVLDLAQAPEVGPGGGGVGALGPQDTMSRESLSRESRNHLREKATLVLAAYRSQTPLEIAMGNDPGGQGGSNDPNSPPKNPGLPRDAQTPAGTPGVGQRGGPP